MDALEAIAFVNFELTMAQDCSTKYVGRLTRCEQWVDYSVTFLVLFKDLEVLVSDVLPDYEEASKMVSFEVIKPSGEKAVLDETLFMFLLENIFPVAYDFYFNWEEDEGGGEETFKEAVHGTYEDCQIDISTSDQFTADMTPELSSKLESMFSYNLN